LGQMLPCCRRRPLSNNWADVEQLLVRRRGRLTEKREQRAPGSAGSQERLRPGPESQALDAYINLFNVFSPPSTATNTASLQHARRLSRTQARAVHDSAPEQQRLPARNDRNPLGLKRARALRPIPLRALVGCERSDPSPVLAKLASRTSAIVSREVSQQALSWIVYRIGFAGLGRVTEPREPSTKRATV